ncbi:MAG: DNA polymerase Y family protein [Stellaceae bacterium]
MRRILYLWLPRWPIDRRRRSAALSGRGKEAAAPAEETPFATVIDTAGRRLLAAVNPAGMTAGLAPGMPLADALSFVPGLTTAAAEPAKDAVSLRRLAEWCGRYSPWTAPDGADGIKIEITGCAHLWGGEGALAADLVARLSRQSITANIAVADTLGAAWAYARFGEAGRGPAILPSGDARAALAPLPVDALRLDLAIAQGLRRVGLKRIGDLYAMPRSALACRFGEAVTQRLDQAFDDLPEPLSPLGETPSRRVRLSFAEPIADPADLALAAERLAQDLVTRLAREGTGARRLALAFYRVDGRVERLTLGTARPSRDPHHIAALFKERIDTIDPGLGIEDVILAAFAVERLGPEQIGLPCPHPNPPPQAGEERGGGSATVWAGEGAKSVSALLDRLGNRLGLAAVSRIEARESHIPERASIKAPVAEPSSTQISALGPSSPAMRKRVPSAARWGRGQRHGDRLKPPRPIRLFQPPEPVEASWLLPDDPPFRFTWRRRGHRVRSADGPERIAEEWWRPGASVAVDAIRDYYRVEDEEGRRFWLFRAGLPDGGHPPCWYVHGVFA